MRQCLAKGTRLQNGKYRIEKVLGQGGFGITYLAEQDLLDRKVAIKEFFFREYCERDHSSCNVTLGTQSNREWISRYLDKFIKEARTISQFDHPHIVRIFDIFRENGTAYYVMEYIEGISLEMLVAENGPICEKEALASILEVASALSYIHQRHVNHLDIKPGNIMLRKSDGKCLVIDFGVSKQYDAVTAEGTTTTPVGVSHGYSPTEQYRQNGVQTFTPQSDVYALAATLYKLLTGETPPEAIAVQEEGLPLQPLADRSVSRRVVEAIVHAMKSRANRTPTIDDFVAELTSSSCGLQDSRKQEETVLPHFVKGGENGDEPTEIITGNKHADRQKQRSGKKTNLRKMLLVVSALALVLGLVVTASRSFHGRKAALSVAEDSLAQASDTASKGVKAELEPTRTFTVNGVSFEMVLVKHGVFTMGATPEQRKAVSAAKPAHQVTLTKDYYIGKTEVTQALWKAVMGTNPSRRKGDQKPVEHISWNDCNKFLSRLNELTNMNFRLPTEAEWEFAARGGNESKGYQFSGGNDVYAVAWYNDDGQTHDVATKQPNELGIYDMTGNVWEYCQDYYAPYTSDPQTDPQGPENGTKKVIRGYDWVSHMTPTLADRDHFFATAVNEILKSDYGDAGFRFVFSVDNQEQ